MQDSYCITVLHFLNTISIMAKSSFLEISVFFHAKYLENIVDAIYLIENIFKMRGETSITFFSKMAVEISSLKLKNNV